MTSYPKEKIKILLLENISAEAKKIFQQNGYTNVVTLAGAISEDELINAIADVHILCIRSKTQVTSNVIAAANKLLAVGCFCIGTNQVELKQAMLHGIAVFNAPYSNTRSVAELTIGAMIMLIRKVPEKNRLAHAGVWMKDASNCYELRGKTLGIIGYGNIGSQVSVLAESMGMKVLFYDTQKKLPLGNALAVHSIQDLLNTSDIVSLHIPETVQTFNLINKDTLSQFKPGAILINYARGEVADISALKQGMESGQLSGVALDVYPVEPEKNGDPFTCELQNIPNVLLTPHIGGSTQEAQTDIGHDVSEKLIGFIEHGNTTGSLTIPALSLPIQEGTHRILHIHRNVPGVMFSINAELAKHGINIAAQYLKTKDEVGYAVLDIDGKLSKEAFDLLKEVKETIKTRMVF